MTEREILAYCAGVLDSDGWITVIKHAPNRAYPDSITLSENVGVTQIGREALDLFLERWGGGISARARMSQPTWRTLYYWRVSNRKAVACIRDLRPYLRVKAQQADLLLALRASKDRPRSETKNVRVGVRGTRVNPDVLAERLAISDKLRALNHG